MSEELRLARAKLEGFDDFIEAFRCELDERIAKAREKLVKQIEVLEAKEDKPT
jgi:hypothetical protein